MIEKIDYNKKKKVFFIGIGGISMSALALILKNNGYDVLGSDRDENDQVKDLQKKGIKVYIGHKKEHITSDIDLVVYTSAIHPDNEELQETKAKNIECIQRSKLLGLIMKNYGHSINVAGTHGKTTVTSIIAKLLVENDCEPTVTVGGMLKDIGGNLYIGKRNDLFLAEACEYTNSFLDFFPTIEVITNIDSDHLDFFKDINDIRNSFKKFINLMDANGLLIINKNIDDIDYLIDGYNGKVLTYGVDVDADYVGKNIKKSIDGQTFDLYKNDKFIANIPLSLFGNHNVENAVAAIGCLLEYGVNINNINNKISTFTGCDRRLQKKGVYNGISIMDDYAHHPNEIRASIKALKEIPCNKMYLIYQPHTYSRTKALFGEFIDSLKDAENLIMIDIYAARENNIYNIGSEDVINEINNQYHKNAKYISTIENVKEYIKSVAKDGDIVVTMGAGNVYIVGDLLIKDYMQNKNNNS